MEYKCSKCDSENVQPISMLLATGIQEGNILGTEFNSKGGIDFSTSSLQLKSRLAAKYDPGPKPIIFGVALFTTLGTIGGLFALFVLLSAIRSKDTPPIAWGCGILVLLVSIALLFSRAFIRSSHEKALARWEAKNHYANSAWICFRCGHDWIP